MNMKSDDGVFDATPHGVGASEVWLNPHRVKSEQFPLAMEHLEAVRQASDRLRRFAPLLAVLFPELRDTVGIIESPLIDGSSMAQALSLPASIGRLFVKGDHLLPVAGSIKARGGIYAVLVIAEKIALQAGLLESRGYETLASDAARAVFGRHTLSVGSTGNLGLSVGTMAAALGFRTVVHMSSEAKGWKKEKLANLGVLVIEHDGDYEMALAAGRTAAEGDENAYFIDDEDSMPLLYGYATAIDRLRDQLLSSGIAVDEKHPLFVYVPCGVGGAPAGIALGLRLAFGNEAHCFFAEPVEAPCVMLAMKQPPGSPTPSVYDVGLSGQTVADGLAVPRASKCAVEISLPLVSGVFTASDDAMLQNMALTFRQLSTRIEPSAAAGFSGPASMASSEELRRYINDEGLSQSMEQATHVVWATGGNLIPEAVFAQLMESVRKP